MSARPSSRPASESHQWPEDSRKSIAPVPRIARHRQNGLIVALYNIDAESRPCVGSSRSPMPDKPPAAAAHHETADINSSARHHLFTGMPVIARRAALEARSNEIIEAILRADDSAATEKPAAGRESGHQGSGVKVRDLA